MNGLVLLLKKTSRFLLAQLHLGSLPDKVTPKSVRRALQELPKGSEALNIAYEEAIERIEAQNQGLRHLAKGAICWIFCATRPLKIFELRHALAVEDDAEFLDEDNLPEAEDILSTCAGLVILDEDSDIVRLVHYTTQEYFEKTSSHWNSDTHGKIAKTCLIYLSFIAARESSQADDDECLPKFGFWVARDMHESLYKTNAFLEYSATYWGLHYERTRDESRDGIRQQLAQIDVDINCYRNTYEEPPLFMAVRLGQQNVVRLLLQQEDLLIERRDVRNNTVVALAAEENHQDIVKLLLEIEDVEINDRAYNRERALIHAVEHGNEAMIVLLLGKDDIEVNARSSQDAFPPEATPLMTAVVRANVPIVKHLLQK